MSIVEETWGKAIIEAVENICNSYAAHLWFSMTYWPDYRERLDNGDCEE